ncbi:hypothetical protein NUACC21_79930 [Scytonema sp. NUACC21]
MSNEQQPEQGQDIFTGISEIFKKLSPDVVVLALLAVAIVWFLPATIDKFPNEQRLFVLCLVLSLAFGVGFFVFLKDRKIAAIRRRNSKLQEEKNKANIDTSRYQQKLRTTLEEERNILLNTLDLLVQINEETPRRKIQNLITERMKKIDEALSNIDAYSVYTDEIIEAATREVISE